MKRPQPPSSSSLAGTGRVASRLVWGGRLITATLAALAWLVTTAPPTTVAAKDPDARKFDRALAQRVAANRAGEVPVIVRYRDGADRHVEDRLATRGRGARFNFRELRSLTVDLSPDDLRALAEESAVESLSLDVDVYSFASGSGKAGTSKLLETLGVDPAAEDAADDEADGRRDARGRPTPGTPIGVAIIDSGIEPEDDFGQRVTAFYTFAKGRVTKTAASDAFGHGTHVAGLVGGDGEGSNGSYEGLAAGVHLIGLKVLDGAGVGRTSDVIAALEFARSNRQRLGIDIVNLSLGHPILEPAATDPLVQAVEAAVRSGLVVVCSAGNFGVHPDTGQPGYGGITSPGNAPSCLTVGAFDTRDTIDRSDDRMAPYSSRGPSWFDGFAKPDLVAPGYAITSVAARDSYLYETFPAARVEGQGPDLGRYGRSGYSRSVASGDYLRLSGTSMAAAIASGAVARVLEVSRAAFPDAPALTPNAVKALLQFTALPLSDDTGALYDPLTQGTGALNVEGALRLAAVLHPGRRVGAWWLTAGVVPATTIAGRSLPWAQVLIWGDTLVAGDTIYYNRPAWATGTVWGNNIVWGGRALTARASSLADQGVIWGQNIVWGGRALTARASSVWAENIVWGGRALTVGAQTVDWGTALVWGPDAVWGQNIVWGGRALTANNIVWGGRALTIVTR